MNEEETYEYKMGYSAGFNGADTHNCNFSLFSTPEKTKKWEKGNRDGLRDKELPQ